MCKKFFYTFLHFSNFNQNQMSKNKIEPTEPIEPIELKLDFSRILTIFKIEKIKIDDIVNIL